MPFAPYTSIWYTNKAIFRENEPGPNWSPRSRSRKGNIKDVAQELIEMIGLYLSCSSTDQWKPKVVLKLYFESVGVTLAMRIKLKKKKKKKDTSLEEKKIAMSVCAIKRLVVLVNCDLSLKTPNKISYLSPFPLPTPKCIWNTDKQNLLYLIKQGSNHGVKRIEMWTNCQPIPSPFMICRVHFLITNELIFKYKYQIYSVIIQHLYTKCWSP